MKNEANLISIDVFHNRVLGKVKHVEACLMDESQYGIGPGFKELNLPINSAAGISFDDICISTNFLGKALKAPLMIAPMTGGMELGARLNKLWAKAAEHFGIAFGVGSQRLAIDNEDVKKSFMVRQVAPTTMLFANMGAAQLCQDGGVDSCLKAVDMIEADALFVHLNPIQEACKENGNRNFKGLLDALATLVAKSQPMGIPVLVREVGFGLSEKSARDLISTGIAGIDCAGAGGTSWAKVEALCAKNPYYKTLANTFGNCGIPTVDSIRNVKRASQTVPLIATGGIRDGLDVAKAIALGANMAGMARPMLQAAVKGESELFLFIANILDQLRLAMFAAGAKKLSDLHF